MRNIQSKSTALLGLLLSLGLSHNACAEIIGRLSSPDKSIEIAVEQDSDGRVLYSVSRYGSKLVSPSVLAFLIKDTGRIERGLELKGTKANSKNETWEQPWGESRFVVDKHNEMRFDFVEKGEKHRAISVTFRAFDDGIGFRYSFPDKNMGEIAIEDEMTEFNIAPKSEALWIPAGEPNRYEQLYRKTPLSEVTQAHTPITIKTKDGIYMSFHEAALVDYSAIWLRRTENQTLRTQLSPGPNGIKVRRNAPFDTPWRTIRISDTAGGLYESNLELNLNEPNKLGDVSWVKPMKYVGVWWEMHLDEKSWESGKKHGATTQNTKRHIDFAAENGFKAVLVEGWNIGWDGDWVANGDKFLFDKAYPDFDIKYLSEYAKSKGVFIMGHNETSANICNYEAQLENSLKFDVKYGIKAVKTGYVQDAGGVTSCDNGIKQSQWHDGQRMSVHHLKVVTEAAKYKVAINPHEPIKDTGLRRTYPNWVSREGARGQEYNAWAVPPNPPEHEPNLIFTRMLSGPFDFTPGVLSLKGRGGSKIENTIARQLADYVVLYSPIQMVPDLPENYAKHKDAFQFIKDVPTDWQKTKVLAGEIGDYAVIARQDRNSNDWFIGAVTDEIGRKVNINFNYLDPKKKYIAEIYRDGEGADYRTNQFAIAIEKKPINVNSTLELFLAPGGGAAIAIKEVR
jgi:alpha-glucosidase